MWNGANGIGAMWASEVSVSVGRKGVPQQLHLDSDIARLIHSLIKSERMTWSLVALSSFGMWGESHA